MRQTRKQVSIIDADTFFTRRTKILLSIFPTFYTYYLKLFHKQPESLDLLRHHASNEYIRGKCVKIAAMRNMNPWLAKGIDLLVSKDIDRVAGYLMVTYDDVSHMRKQNQGFKIQFTTFEQSYVLMLDYDEITLLQKGMSPPQALRQRQVKRRK